jgi:lysophospholipase L1-like esterase
VQTILCYGDSNTWGYNPQTRDRFPADVRWTGVLQHELGAAYRVLEEGLNGRTTVWDDPIEQGRNGRTYLLPCLASHRPLDLVTILLGTNDLKRRFNLSPSDIAQSASVLAEMAMNSGSGPHAAAPVVLLMAPPPVGPLSDLAGMFEGAEAKSREFHHWYWVFAGHIQCAYFDTADVIVSSPVDGIHWDASAHATLGRAMADAVRQLLSSGA